MSQSDYHSESSVSGLNGPSPPLPSSAAKPPASAVPPPQTPASQPANVQSDPHASDPHASDPRSLPPVPPPVLPPPTPSPAAVDQVPPSKLNTNPTQANPASPKKQIVVPPPPPPRSTLPPIKRGPEISPTVSGVGSAKGPRWRGELEDINRKAEAKEDARRQLLLAAEMGRDAPPETVAEAEEEYEEPLVTRSAPPWLLSTVIHLVLLLILALITTPAGAGLGRVLLVMGLSEQQSDSTLTEFTIEAPTEEGVDLETLESIETPIDPREIFSMTQPISEEVVAPEQFGEGPAPIDFSMPMFNGRTGAMKKALLSIYGGTPETEAAVVSGLAWLKRNQQRDGSWSMRGPYGDGSHAENRAAATAMALLAFMGDGNTHKAGEYKDEVLRGIKFLIQSQGRDGFLARDARSHEKMYAQAQATIALCELYGMTGDSWLRPPAQLAVKYAERSQSSEGGWRYEPRFDSDTSVTGWFVMALKSAESTDLDVNGSMLDRVMRYLDTVSSEYDAAYAYQARQGPSPAMTAEGILCRQYLGWKREHPPMQRGLEALLLGAPFDLGDRDVYYWYYATQALHHFGGPMWREWNKDMRVMLPRAQVKAGREKGSWAPQGDQWGQNAGRLYTTCLSIYCLEVYYRHMPLYKNNALGEEADGEKSGVVEGSDGDADAAKRADDGFAVPMDDAINF